MTADRLSEYKIQFPVGTAVIYTPPSGLGCSRGRVASAPCLFKTGFDTCVVTLDNGLVVPCKDLVVDGDGK